MSNTFGFQDFINKINEQKNFIETAIDETLEEAATECVAETQSRTPVKTGNLRRAWTHGKVQVEGNIHYVDITNPLEYAAAIENGHKQQVGRYVPAIGKRLKASFVPGRHMLRDSITIAKAELPERLRRKIGEIK
jgi:Bacteriophage protein of unknown function (DUF646).